MLQSSSKATETILEIDLNALDANFRFLKSKIPSATKFMAVVKAFAYGSDSQMVAKELESLGVDYFAVAYAYEGKLLREAGVSVPILVLHSLEANFETILESCLEPNLYSVKILKDFIAFAEKHQQKNYPIHLKFNSGLNRLGFSEKEMEDLVSLLKKTRSVRVASLFSHLAATEDPSEKDFTLKQIERFENWAASLSETLGYQPLKHTVNTSGILNYPQAHFDMVRSGIGLYGFGNEAKYHSALKPIAALKTIISQIHELQKGESLGYNRGFVAEKFTRTATLPLGHADGIGRIYGHGKGWVTIHGKKAPILGIVCMDMIMVDVTEIPCEEGDEVIVFGETHTAEDLASSAKTISYELITSISQRVKRVICRK